MAFTRTYKQGAIIYLAGDKGEDIYILKSGLVTLSYKSVDNTNSIEKLKEGDFFGVKSALGHFAREETAMVKGDSAVLVLKAQEFEELAAKNINIILKMLKIFSTQLRKIGKRATLLMSKSGKEDSNAYSLFKLGEYYLKAQKFDQALYALHKYLEHFPEEDNVYEARKYIDMAKREETISGAERSFGEEDEKGSMGVRKAKEPEVYYNRAINSINKGKYDRALAQLEECEAVIQGKEGDELLEKLGFNKSVCYFKLRKYEESIASFTDFIKAHPKTSYMKQTLFYIGLAYRDMDNREKAISFFKKIASMSPEDKLSKQAIDMLNELAN